MVFISATVCLWTRHGITPRGSDDLGNQNQLRAGIDPCGVRLACGLEEPAILIEEMEKGFKLI